MSKFFRVSAAAALAASAALAGAAKANEGTTYYYSGDDGYQTYTDTDTPSGTYHYSVPAVVAPAPQVYYAPIYTERSNTTYYHSGSTHEGYVGSSPAYRTYYERRVVYPPATTYYSAPAATPYYYSPPPPRGYVPPGLSISTPTGTYAPFYGGWNSYSMENNGYRIGR